MNDNFYAICPICNDNKLFYNPGEYNLCRDGLVSFECEFGMCATRERAVASVLFDNIGREHIKNKVIFECAPANRGLSLYLKKACANYQQTGYYPDAPFGKLINGLLNEDLENLTLINSSIDVWIHLDVLEHLLDPFKALNEIYRTLKDDGICIFTAPTYPNLLQSEQVAWLNDDSTYFTKGSPEYHGDPQHPENGAIVTWRYGYDLPSLIQQQTNFSVKVVRYQSKRNAVMGPMTEVYFCSK